MDEAGRNSVLIVDDERANIIALTHILSPEYTVYAAKNGQDAVEVANEFLPDVILLDILMPEMDGYEVLTALKNGELTQSIPVIFVTGLGNSEDEEKGLNSGASDYISKPFSPSVVKLRVKNQLRIVNQIRIINHLSATDQLTGIPNRRSFDNQLNREWGRSVREKKPLSILLLDVDHFKNYNDVYGHQQGDAALQSIAMTIKKTIRRSSDFAARWGGEEFVALLPATDKKGAMEIGEKIRYNIEQTPIPVENGEVTRVTVSIGVSVMTPAQNNLPEDFITYADKALYNAKETGRNKVCGYEGPDLDVY